MFILSKAATTCQDTMTSTNQTPTVDLALVGFTEEEGTCFAVKNGEVLVYDYGDVNSGHTTTYADGYILFVTLYVKFTRTGAEDEMYMTGGPAMAKITLPQNAKVRNIKVKSKTVDGTVRVSKALPS